MRSRAEATVAAVLVGMLVACGAPAPTTTRQPTLGPTASPVRSASPTPLASPTPAVALPDPGRPWDGETVLAEMEASNRPDGVPARLRTPAVATAVADAVWTVDGSTWDTFTIGGFCGTTTCTVELAGAHLGRAGEDLWVLGIDPGTGAVTTTDATVRSLPVDLVEALDRMARNLAEAVPPDALAATVRWLPPPEDAGRFVLNYRTGGEEGSCGVDIELDANAGRIVEETPIDC